MAAILLFFVGVSMPNGITHHHPYPVSERGTSFVVQYAGTHNDGGQAPTHGMTRFRVVMGDVAYGHWTVHDGNVLCQYFNIPATGNAAFKSTVTWEQGCTDDVDA